MGNLIFGNPQNITEGTWYSDRASLMEAGLHRYPMHGIDGNGIEGAASIVLSGGYEDDEDYGDKILYTGHGGNDPQSKRQIAHQTWESPGNRGLQISHERKLPVRVIRGYKHSSRFSPKSGFVYSGLFYVTSAWIETGRSGFRICRFELEKDFEKDTDQRVQSGVMVHLKATNLDPMWYSIDIKAPKAREISSESKMGQLLLNKKAGDFVAFGPGMKILEIRRYLS